jgi:mitotic spindle assembly checkpoint protein MAD1
MLEQELTQTQSLAQERAQKINTLKEQLDDLEAAQDNKSVNLADEQWKIVRDELQRQTDQLRTSQTLNARLTSEVEKYRSRNQNIEILREEKRDLERKLSHLEGLKDRSAKLEGELEAARMEREGWSVHSPYLFQFLHRYIAPSLHDRVAFLKDPSGEPTSSTPTAVTRTLMDLRLANATLSEERGSIKGLLQYRTQQLAETERRLTDVEAQCAGLKELVGKANERTVRRQQKIKLLEMEQASSNALLATFTAEEAIFQEAGTYDAQKVARIHDLEQILAEYKATNEELRRLIEQAADRQDDESRYRYRTKGNTPDLERMSAEEHQARQRLEQGGLFVLTPNERDS